MRTWLGHVTAAAGRVAEHPLLWLPGALAWLVTTGWLTFVIGVAQPPTQSELTFLGAGLSESGLWPWNAAAIGLGVGAVVLALFGLFSVAEASLLVGRRASPRLAGRILVVTLTCAAPALLMLAGLATGFAVLAPGAFNAPDPGIGPVARIAVRLAPLIAAFVAVATLGAAIQAAASRSVVAGRSLAGALWDAPRTLFDAGFGSALQTVSILAARGVSLALGATLLRVLWAPIDDRLRLDGFDLAVAFLLLGFVAIWLCLVLGGGALHAWGSTAWTRVIGLPTSEAESSLDATETRG